MPKPAMMVVMCLAGLLLCGNIGALVINKQWADNPDNKDIKGVMEAVSNVLDSLDIAGFLVVFFIHGFYFRSKR